MAEFSISQHFENKNPVVKSIYERISIRRLIDEYLISN